MNKLPSGKSIAVWVGAVALACWSLPQPPHFPVVDRYGAHYSHHRTHGAIPTVTQPSADSPAQKQPQAGQGGANLPSPNQGQTQPPSPPVNAPPAPAPPAMPPSETSGTQFSPYVPWPTAKLRLRVIDGRTHKPLAGAEVVVIETEQRFTTDENGYTPWTDAPVIRNPRYRPLVAELHGQLGAIAYKNGYRDSVHLGIRMHEGIRAESTIWMYKLGPGDTRIEPVLYQVPYHHIWLVELVDKFRSKTQPGEGPQQP